MEGSRGPRVCFGGARPKTGPERPRGQTMEFTDTIADVHAVAVITPDQDSVLVLTSDGWRCYQILETDRLVSTGSRQAS